MQLISKIVFILISTFCCVLYANDFERSNIVPTMQSPSNLKITLITGDTVSYEKNSTSTFRVYEKGSSKLVQHKSLSINGQLYLIPLKAQPLINLNILDQEFFNINKLVNYELDDASSSLYPILIKYKSPFSQANLITNASAITYEKIRTQYIELKKSELVQTWAEITKNLTIEKINLDEKINHH
ncbi:hypothetical protein NQT69_08370 [Pseudoalteromonas shioyasakiensis]|uniref:hypothetical protein n=1 Tax=Pseudoalteromonas shioyasakiensis TaxID=1190813 RepID=UPI0021190178|nr:hypothetical protein [Pseudoalteromonas shioyasakiensis]MCQ8878008.1 hypothetical protein [Pseudoalteromonas shioyasakiensis]